MKANISTLRKPDILILRRQAARLLVLCGAVLTLLTCRLR
jgi:hypothetical protein